MAELPIGEAGDGSPEIVHFNLNDPVDHIIYKNYRVAIDVGPPNDKTQHELVKAIQEGKETAVTSLIQLNALPIAVMAHYYKRPRLSSKKLFKFGAKAVQEAAKQFPLENTRLNFTDFSLLALEAAYASSVKDEKPITEGHIERPSDWLVHYLTGLEPTIDFIRESEAINQKIVAEFSPKGQKILLLLNLPRKEIAKKVGMSKRAVYNKISNLLQQTGAKNATQLALEMQARGVRFNLPEPPKPLVDLLTDENFRVGQFLDLPNEEIAAILNKPASQVDSMVFAIKEKLGAANRVEAALMIRAFDTGERRNVTLPRINYFGRKIGHKVLEVSEFNEIIAQAGLTDKQRQTLELYYRDRPEDSWPKLANILGVTEQALLSRDQAAIRRIRRFILSTTVRQPTS